MSASLITNHNSANRIDGFKAQDRKVTYLTFHAQSFCATSGQIKKACEADRSSSRWIESKNQAAFPFTAFGEIANLSCDREGLETDNFRIAQLSPCFVSAGIFFGADLINDDVTYHYWGLGSDARVGFLETVAKSLRN